MSDAADGYLGDYAPQRATCRCTDCQLDRAQQRIAQQDAEIEALREQYKMVFETGKNRYEQVLTLKALLREIYQQVTNGRLCYFGDHTGYEPQFSSAQTERWAAALGTDQQLQPKGGEL